MCGQRERRFLRLSEGDCSFIHLLAKCFIGKGNNQDTDKGQRYHENECRLVCVDVIHTYPIF